MEKTHVTVMQDRRITTRLLAESIGVSMEVARKICLKRFGEKEDWFKICATLWWNRESSGLNVFAVSSNFLTKIMICCK
jgi:hypothetical protein